MLPALELDDGSVITEAPCIFRYLENQHPEPNLLGNDPLESAQIEAWERFAEMQGMAAIGEFFRNQMDVLKDRAMPGFSGIALIPELVERGKKRTAWFYQQLEKRLDHHPVARILVERLYIGPFVKGEAADPDGPSEAALVEPHETG